MATSTQSAHRKTFAQLKSNQTQLYMQNGHNKQQQHSFSPKSKSHTTAQIPTHPTTRAAAPTFTGLFSASASILMAWRRVSAHAGGSASRAPKVSADKGTDRPSPYPPTHPRPAGPRGSNRGSWGLVISSGAGFDGFAAVPTATCSRMGDPGGSKAGAQATEAGGVGSTTNRSLYLSNMTERDTNRSAGGMDSAENSHNQRVPKRVD